VQDRQAKVAIQVREVHQEETELLALKVFPAWLDQEAVLETTENPDRQDLPVKSISFD
jgi:hypothetical protein